MTADKRNSNLGTGPKEPPCGDVYLDGRFLGRFTEGCAEVEKLLTKMTGRRIRLPRPKPDPDDRFPIGDDILSMELKGGATCSKILRRGPRKSFRGMAEQQLEQLNEDLAGTAARKLGQLAHTSILRKSRRHP